MRTVSSVLLIRRPCTTLCTVAFQEETGQLQLCKQKYCMFSRRLKCAPIIPSMPHSNTLHESLNLDTLPQQIQYDTTLLPPPTLENPYVGQPQTLYQFLSTDVSINNWQQDTPLTLNSLGPHPQSQECTEPTLLDPFHRASTGPPPEATTSIHRESVDEPEPQVTSLPPE